MKFFTIIVSNHWKFPRGCEEKNLPLPLTMQWEKIICHSEIKSQAQEKTQTLNYKAHEIAQRSTIAICKSAAFKISRACNAKQKNRKINPTTN